MQNLILLLASYIFYAWWDVRLLSLIVISTMVNYYCGIMIGNGQINMKDRLISSTGVIIICLFSVVLSWNEPHALQNIFNAKLNWNLIGGNESSWLLFFTICLGVTLCNVFYSKSVLLDERKKKLLFVTIGVTVNLLILGFFKYYNFFIENIELLLAGLNFEPTRFHLNIILPIGISFYTFKGISYIIDVYRGHIAPEEQHINFALFIGFFPSLLAGPLDRAKNLLSQFTATRKPSADDIFAGLHLFLYGLFKKVVIADGVIRTVNSVFGSSGRVSWLDVIVATFFFTIQIYCDFSGYTDMARGTARFFGIHLTINFNLPYFSKNPREFWSRWHISLSTWLRDYLYIPLGGNRHGRTKTYRNLMMTMALGGLWHGAAWNFVLWGIYHGCLLCFHRAISSVKNVTSSYMTFLNIIKITFFFAATCYGWLLFRAESSAQIINLTSVLIFDFGNTDFHALRPRAAVVLGLPILLCIEFIEYKLSGKRFYERLPISAWTAIYAVMIFSLFLGMSNESAQFIYFNF